MPAPSTPIRFAIIGAGWRSDFYLRVCRALPDHFAITGVLTRDTARAAAITRDWAVPASTTLDDLLATDPAFVVVSVPWAVTPMLLRELADRGVPALAETPPAPDVDGLRALRSLGDARIQVAEQYQFQPYHAARLAIATSGRLGTVTEAQMSIAHGYHGIDLMRRFLAVGDEPVTIRATRFTSSIVAGPDRHGPPATETLTESHQVIAWFDFGDRLGVMDFTDDQYFSWIRSTRSLVRGERGEINDLSVRWLQDAATPVSMQLTRHDTGQGGNLEGHHLVGIAGGGDWIYRNAFAPARLADEEIAVATTLTRMHEWLDGGPAICSLAHGAQDHYLNLRMGHAAESRETVHVPGHVWDV